MQLTETERNVQTLYRWTAAQYQQLVQLGVLTKNDRVELLDGQIINMSPVGNPHAACVDILTELLSDILRGRPQLRIQSHVQLDDFSMPEPDISILHRRQDWYANSPPQREHIYFLIEVSESTLARDQKHKLATYARACIAEVWIVDLSGRSIYRYTEPVEEAFRVVQTFREGEEIGSVQQPEVRLKVENILPMPG